MLHLVCFSGAKTDSTNDEAAPSIPDSSLTQTANAQNYLAPFDALVVAAFAMNDTITRARLVYPSYRDIGLPEISPLIALAEPSADFDLCVWGTQGPRIRKTEEFGIQSSNGLSTVDTIHAGVWLMDVMTPVPGGRRFTVRGTSAQTLVASRWTLGGITLDQTLPYGRYGVIGLQVTCNDAVAGRLVFPSNTSMRPGVVCGETIAILDPRQTFRSGQFGLLGSFEQTAPPQLELLGGTAGAETAAVILDLVELK